MAFVCEQDKANHFSKASDNLATNIRVESSLHTANTAADATMINMHRKFQLSEKVVCAGSRKATEILKNARLSLTIHAFRRSGCILIACRLPYIVVARIDWALVCAHFLFVQWACPIVSPSIQELAAAYFIRLRQPPEHTSCKNEARQKRRAERFYALVRTVDVPTHPSNAL